MRKLNFQIKILFMSFIATIVLGLIIIPLLKKLKIGQIEREDGPESHLKKQGTPTMGGIIIAIAVVILTILLIFDYSRSKAQSETQVAKNLIPLVLVALGFGVIGCIDDIKKLIFKNTKGLKPAYKMLGLLAIAVSYTLFLVKGVNLGTDTYIPFLKIYIDLPIFIYIPFAIFVMLATTNAVNLTDGVDGSVWRADSNDDA